MDNRASRRLNWIETGRGLAALAVVIFHANVTSVLEGWVSWNGFSFLRHGVDFFFVLSGFIIFYAHCNDIGRPGALRGYLGKRAIRLLPLLWLIVPFWFVGHWLVGEPGDWGMFVRSMLPYPSFEEVRPAVVWTLRHEFLFYTIFAVLVAAPALGRSIFILWGVGAVIQLGAISLGRPIDGIAALFLSPYTLDFLFGIGIAWLHRRYSFAPAIWPLIAGIALVILLAVKPVATPWGALPYPPYVSMGNGWYTVLLGIAFGLVVHGLVCIEERWQAPRMLVALGGTTYALYLAHTMAIGLSARFLNKMPDGMIANGGGFIWFLFISIAVGFALHRGFERPVSAWLRPYLLTKGHLAARRDGAISAEYRNREGASVDAAPQQTD